MDLEFPRSCIQGLGDRPLVLAVDDDDDNLMVLCQALELFGCSCIWVPESQFAPYLAKTHQPDLILLEIRLQKYNGMELVRCLKQEPQTERIPIIAVTALAGKQDRDRILKLGCDDYISKPYMLDDLDAVIHRQLNNRWALLG